MMKRNVTMIALALALVLALGAGIQALAGVTLSKEEVSGIIETTTDPKLVTSPIIQVAKSASQSVVGVNNYQSRSSDF